MYRLKGYVVDVPVRGVVNYSPNREIAVNFCNQHGVPVNYIQQIYTNTQPIYKTEPDQVIDLYEPDSNGNLVKAKD